MSTDHSWKQPRRHAQVYAGRRCRVREPVDSSPDELTWRLGVISGCHRGGATVEFDDGGALVVPRSAIRAGGLEVGRSASPPPEQERPPGLFSAEEETAAAASHRAYKERRRRELRP